LPDDPMPRAPLEAIKAYCEAVPSAYAACDHSEPMTDSEEVLYRFWLRVRTDLPALAATYEEAMEALGLILRWGMDWPMTPENCDLYRAVLNAAARLVREFEA